MTKTQDNKKIAKKLLNLADIKVGGKRPQDIKVYDDRFYQQALTRGSLGVGESYMDGLWDANRLDSFFYQVFSSHLEEKVKGKLRTNILLYGLKGYLINRQTGKRAYKNAQAHYDIGNDLYRSMLGKTMAYSCAYWEWGAKDIDQAQIDKFDLICKKLGLKKGMKVLDVGCGWGGLPIHMAKKYGCEVTCITPSKEQIAYIKSHIKNEKIIPKLSTWQDFKTRQKFDRIVSVGMLEHVGPKNYQAYFKAMNNLLTDGGIKLVQTIGNNISTQKFDPWMDKYIFPGGILPSIKQIAKACEGLFVTEDWHNFGADYDKTLMAWHKNFLKSYPGLDHQRYDRRFKRMWEFYLLACAGGFRSRNIQLWQIVLSKNGVGGGYKSIR
ncbi:MAG: cyclopropane fatty acyl phospholipid synthase [bacterium]|nr:cyclopropane fatty acyl phospholipid synthase [bacterium]